MDQHSPFNNLPKTLPSLDVLSGDAEGDFSAGSSASERFAEYVPFAAPPISDEPEAPAAPREAPHPENTARIAVALAGIAAAQWSYPLSDDEEAALQRDLVPVLRKHNVPDVPASEELTLAVTVANVVLPRVANRGGGDGDPVIGQKRVWQEYAPAKAGAPQTRSANTADSVLL